jgi:hypothetical protein
MAKSILQQGERCFLCGRTTGLFTHHVIGGTANRKLSEKYGLTVRLCLDCHTGPDGVHMNRKKGDSLKRLAQIAFEARHSHEEWMEIFRKNYL